MPLSTPRLIIREFQPEDWSSVFEYSSDLDVMRFVTYKTDTQEEARAFVQGAITKAHKQPRQEYQWAVTLDSGVLIGGCGIWWEAASPKEAEIGYCFNRRYWGQGYATEAAKALLTFGFEELAMHRIVGRCNAENVASARVMSRCGMRLEGRLIEKTWGLGRWWDELVFAILDHEWKSVLASRGPAGI